MSASRMHQTAVVVKEEPGRSLPAGSCGVSEAAARAGLYTDHEVKDELVVGPECLQPRDAVYALCEAVHAPNSPHHDHTYASTRHVPTVLIKEEVDLVVEADCSGEELECIKQEPPWSKGAGACGGSAAAAQAGLRAAHGGEDAVVSGHESLQPRDGDYILPMCPKEESEYAEEAGCPEEETECWKYDTESVKMEPSCSENIAACGVSAAAARAGLYPGHAVKDELVLGPEHLQRADVANLLYDASLGRGGQLQRPPALNTHADNHSIVEAIHDDTVRGNYLCGICKKRFALKSTMMEHVMVHIHTPPSVEQEGSGRGRPDRVLGVGARSSPRPTLSPSTHTTPAHNTTRGTALSEHTPAHRKKGHTCGVCGKEFARWSYLHKHERVHAVEKLYSCGVCSKKFARRGYLNVHERIHTGEKPYSCGVCSREFASRSNLQKHERVHAGEKPYSCGVCSKEFAQRSNLKIHERIHTGIKPYSCGVCSKKFTHQSSLKDHERIHTGMKLYSCGVCSKKFTHQSSLKVHERIHTGEKPYSCRVCNKEFAHQSNLKNHERIHTGMKLYSCGVCSKKFTHQSSLKIHERIHTGEKPYSCRVCNNEFAHQSSLKNHERIHTVD